MTKLLKQAVSGMRANAKAPVKASRAAVRKASGRALGPMVQAIPSTGVGNGQAGFQMGLAASAAVGAGIGGMYGGDGFSLSGAIGGAALGAGMGFGATAIGGGMVAEFAKDYASLNKNFGKEAAMNIRHLSQGMNSAEGRTMTMAAGGALGGIMVTSGKSRNRKRGFNANRGSSIY